MIFSKSFLRGTAAITCALLVSGCSFAPDYKAPEVAVPPAYEEAGDWAPATPGDTNPKGAWWLAFGDVRLNELENDVTAANQDLKTAVAQYDEARALANLARAGYFPTVTGNAGYEHDRASQNVANKPPNYKYNDYLLGADLSYEVDVWGRVRNAAAAGLDQAQASQADLATIDLSLHAELANDYFQLRGDDAEQIILDQTVDIDQKSFELVRNRFNGGISPELDYDQAQVQVQNARTQAADMRLKRAQLEHAIAVLTGRVPAAFHQPPIPLGETVTIPSVQMGLPSVLLQRRPDIAAAERRVAAANAEIGVAEAAFFPTFSLSAMFGFESANPGRWFSAPSQFWSLGPSSVLTIIDGGRLDALSDQAKAEYNETVGNYRQTVLSAYQDVEDNLAALHHLSDEEITQAAAAKAAQRALVQENYLYNGGAAIFIDVATTENAALQAAVNLVDVRVRRLAASVALFKALGGSWDYASSFAKTPDVIPAAAVVSPLTAPLPMLPTTPPATNMPLQQQQNVPIVPPAAPLPESPPAPALTPPPAAAVPQASEPMTPSASPAMPSNMPFRSNLAIPATTEVPAPETAAQPESPAQVPVVAIPPSAPPQAPASLPSADAAPGTSNDVQPAAQPETGIIQALPDYPDQPVYP